MSADAKYLLKVLSFLALFVWILAISSALYAFGFEGIQAGVDAENYHGHAIDYAIHWILLLGPPLAAAIVCAHAFIKRR